MFYRLLVNSFLVKRTPGVKLFVYVDLKKSPFTHLVDHRNGDEFLVVGKVDPDSVLFHLNLYRDYIDILSPRVGPHKNGESPIKRYRPL